MVYALAKFSIWLETNHPEKKLESLRPQWDKATQIAVQYAKDKIMSTEADDEKQFDQARKKFDAFYKFIQQQSSAGRTGPGQQQERFKRPTNQARGLQNKDTTRISRELCETVPGPKVRQNLHQRHLSCS
eukprot:GABU01000922.1.p1 GENE.GABU01000922.1~~GABU01000922.1.p1  ORF type:complete len:130 (-),score=30.03 GABU01000922.1:27-416(-)